MTKRFGPQDLRTVLESQPAFVVLDQLYGKNSASPIAAGKPAAQKYRELLSIFDDTMSQIAEIAGVEGARDLPFTTLFSISEMILYCLVKYDDILVQVMIPEYQGSALFSHSLNVAFLSGKIGMAMNLSFHELAELCVAGLLHDIGMTKIHAGVYDHDRPLSPEEREQIETHPQLGHEFLKRLEGSFPWLLKVILEEHQRRNELGYPVEPDEKPHVYSRIVGVCDSFEALSHQRPHRKAYHPGDAIKIIIDARTRFFDKEILKAMIDSLSIFPVGSLVQLNTNSIAEVIRAVQGAPLRPVVQIVDAQKPEGSAPVLMDLSVEKSLFITGLVYDERYYVPEKAQSV